jgi:hypothetical protein
MTVKIEQPIFDTQALAQAMQLCKLALSARDIDELAATIHEAELDLSLLKHGYGSGHAWVSLRANASQRVLLITE